MYSEDTIASDKKRKETESPHRSTHHDRISRAGVRHPVSRYGYRTSQASNHYLLSVIMTQSVIFSRRPRKNTSDSLTEDRRRLGSFEVCDSGSFTDVDMTASLSHHGRWNHGTLCSIIDKLQPADSWQSQRAECGFFDLLGSRLTGWRASPCRIPRRSLLAPCRRKKWPADSLRSQLAEHWPRMSQWIVPSYVRF